MHKCLYRRENVLFVFVNMHVVSCYAYLLIITHHCTITCLESSHAAPCLIGDHGMEMSIESENEQRETWTFLFHLRMSVFNGEDATLSQPHSVNAPMFVVTIITTDHLFYASTYHHASLSPSFSWEKTAASVERRDARGHTKIYTYIRRI